MEPMINMRFGGKTVKKVPAKSNEIDNGNDVEDSEALDAVEEEAEDVEEEDFKGEDEGDDVEEKEDVIQNDFMTNSKTSAKNKSRIAKNIKLPRCMTMTSSKEEEGAFSSSSKSARGLNKSASSLSKTSLQRSVSMKMEQRQEEEIVALISKHTGKADPQEIEDLSLKTLAKQSKRNSIPLKSLHMLRDFSNLVRLEACDHTITSLDGLEIFQQLQELYLSRNHIKRIDPIESLIHLRVLDLSGNFVSHLPRTIGSLDRLEQLDLSGNNLSVLKELDVLSKLGNLHECKFAANPFCKLPMYKDYVICKVKSIEKLDDTIVTFQLRDKSRRRFSDSLFSKEECLREVDLAHQNEQNKLREAQDMLEQENLRLKGELQLKSKLLQNKSKEWSNATEQLLQLQQELAMLSIERSGRRPIGSMQSLEEGHEKGGGEEEEEIKQVMTMRKSSVASLKTSLTSTKKQNQQAFIPEEEEQYTQQVQEEEDESYDSKRKIRQTWRLSGFPSPPKPQTIQQQEQQQQKEEQNSTTKKNDISSKSASTPPQKVVNTATSPLFVEPVESPEKASSAITYETFEARSTGTSPLQWSPKKQPSTDIEGYMGVDTQPREQQNQTHAFPSRSKSFNTIGRALEKLSPAKPAMTEQEALESLVFLGQTEPKESISFHEEEAKRKRNSIIGAHYEDDLVCPAYEVGYLDSPEKSLLTLAASSSPNVSRSPKKNSSRASSPSKTKSAFSSATSSISTDPPTKSMSTTSMASLNLQLQRQQQQRQDKQYRAQTIQLLQSKKLVLLNEIGKEEQALHAWRQQSITCEHEIDQFAIVAQESAFRAKEKLRMKTMMATSFSAVVVVNASNTQRPAISLSLASREEENRRAKMEMLRNKLHFTEAKEKEIEGTIVRMTKKVLQQDIRNSLTANSFNPFSTSNVGSFFPGDIHDDMLFDKEIFALTHKLQLVITQKEELQLEMSRLMTQMADANYSAEYREGAEKDRRRATSIDQMMESWQIQQPSFEKMEEEEIKQKAAHDQATLEQMRARHAELLDRINAKEELIGALIKQLKETETQLQQLNNDASSLTHRNVLETFKAPSSPPASVQKGLYSPSLFQPTIVAPEIEKSVYSFKTRTIASDESDDLEPIEPAEPIVKQEERESIVKTSVNNAFMEQEVPVLDIKALLSSGLISSTTTASGASEDKVKEILTESLLEELKKDIFDKLSAQMQALVVENSNKQQTPDVSNVPSCPSVNLVTQQEQEELLQVISETIEEEMKRAMEIYQLKKQETEFSTTLEIPASAAPIISALPPSGPVETPQTVYIPADVLIHAHNSLSSSPQKPQVNRRVESVPMKKPNLQLEKMINFETSEVIYKLQHQFKKSSSNIVTMSEETQKILRACLRLESILKETRLNKKTAMELDSKGRIKSSLKVHLMGARDLPYAHLRTKNLDPYVTLQIVYNKKFQSKKKKDEDDPQEEKIVRSRTIKKTMYPVWEEDFDIFPIQILQGYLHVRIINDRKMSREQLIGEVKIPLKKLTDQKRLVEWYPLTCPSIDSTSSVSESDAHHDDHVSSSYSSRSSRLLGVPTGSLPENGNGAVHLQLQLTFNKVEKMKRTLDEMISTYHQEHQALPRFIQPVPANTTDDINFVVESMTEEENMGSEENELVSTEISREARAESNNSPKKEDTLENLEESLSNFSEWKSKVQKTLEEKKKRASEKPYQVAPTKKGIAKQTSNQSKTSEHGKYVTFNLPTGSASVKPYSKTMSNNNHMELKRTSPQLFTSTSSLVPMDELISYGKIHYIQPALQRPSNKPSFDRPECFDEYSIYHPDHQITSMYNNIPVSSKSPRSSNNQESNMMENANLIGMKKANLSIFKSPGYGRRQSRPLPDRFIGLDNQNSERYKRLFGRMNNV